MASRNTSKLILDNLIDLKPDGSFRLDMSYFDYCTGLTMTNERFRAVRRASARPGQAADQFPYGCGGLDPGVTG